MAGLLPILLGVAADAVAAPVTLNGITFSDELGGVVILGGRGSGTEADPFVLEEAITDEGPAILTIRGLERRGAERLAPQPVAGFALTKIVTNRTERVWTIFELELREELERPSSYEDGLSFAQAAPSLGGFGADRFAHVRRSDEPLDAVEFEDGIVRPGETVTVRMVITDYTPISEFFLLQRREGRVASVAPCPWGCMASNLLPF